MVVLTLSAEPLLLVFKLEELEMRLGMGHEAGLREEARPKAVTKGGRVSPPGWLEEDGAWEALKVSLSSPSDAETKPASELKPNVCRESVVWWGSAVGGETANREARICSGSRSAFLEPKVLSWSGGGKVGPGLSVNWREKSTPSMEGRGLSIEWRAAMLWRAGPSCRS
jgi:hypothetical protein